MKILVRNTAITKIFRRNVVHNYYENLFEECCYYEISAFSRNSKKRRE